MRAALVFSALLVGGSLLGGSLLGCDASADPPVAADRGEAPRAASEFRSSRVGAAIDAASALVRTRGFAAVESDWRGFLVEHSSDVRSVPMRSGTCYVGIAAASRGVRDLSLRVFDSDGGEVMSDGAIGPLAALRFCPSQSGTYYVAAVASAGSGLFEVRTFRGPTGLEIRMDDVFREVAPPSDSPEER